MPIQYLSQGRYIFNRPLGPGCRTRVLHTWTNQQCVWPYKQTWGWVHRGQAHSGSAEKMDTSGPESGQLPSGWTQHPGTW